ncbi:hypothetical protein NDU88_004493 [Pleurodeles waltl]|uniref:Uncharacterized protein n=1 Tax=Pleurodeles waltl TaxID=8319 RepID=A0AAV7KYJ5_PLEWA|nr:hypothetical protein NDU88_004493 [Pleurodeles waltl]
MAALLPVGTQGALLACLVLLLVIDTGWCQHGQTIGKCTDCIGHMKEHLPPQKIRTYAHKDTQIVLCQSIVNKEWVTTLKTCKVTGANGRLKGELKNPTLAPKTDTVKHVIGAVLSLLAALIGLVSLVTYLIRRRKLIRRDTII